jgi:hypothetical protein
MLLCRICSAPNRDIARRCATCYAVLQPRGMSPLTALASARRYEAERDVPWRNLQAEPWEPPLWDRPRITRPIDVPIDMPMPPAPKVPESWGSPWDPTYPRRYPTTLEWLEMEARLEAIRAGGQPAVTRVMRREALEDALAEERRLVELGEQPTVPVALLALREQRRLQHLQEQAEPPVFAGASEPVAEPKSDEAPTIEPAIEEEPGVTDGALEAAVGNEPTIADDEPTVCDPIPFARRPKELTHPSVIDDLVEATTRAWRRRRGDPRIGDVIRELHQMKVERVGAGTEKPDSVEFSERTLQRKLHEIFGPGREGTWAGWLTYWRLRRPEK